LNNIKEQHFKINNKDIYVFDGAINFNAREYAYGIIKDSLYKIGNEDADAIETSHHKYMYSLYNEKDVEITGILKEIQDTRIQDLISGKIITRAHVNLSTPTDCHWAHTHKDEIVLLYYVNKHWKHDWAGETMFFNDDLSEVAYASIYKPGRIIVFDGEIPHSVRPQSSIAPNYRFTLSLFFKNNNI